MLGLGGVGHVCCHSPAAHHSPQDRVASAGFGIMLAQASSPQLNWWDGLVESWLNLPLWAVAGALVGVIFLVIALAGSVVLWASAAATKRHYQRLSVPASIRFGWLAIPGWSKAVQFSLIGLIALVGFTALSGRPVADLRVSTTEVAFGGVVTGGTATSDLTLRNLGTAGSPAIKIKQVTVSGEHATLFSVVSGAEAVVPPRADAVVTIPQSTIRAPQGKPACRSSRDPWLCGYQLAAASWTLISSPCKCSGIAIGWWITPKAPPLALNAK